MSHKPSLIDLTIAILSKKYILGTLSFNIRKKELCYLLTYPKESSESHLNCNTGEFTARLDHITWHQKCVHIKRLDGVSIDRIQFSHPPLFSNTPVIKPIYVESHYFQTIPCLKELTCLKQRENRQSQEILCLKQPIGFSILFVLIPSKLSTTDFLLGWQFPNKPKGMDVFPCLVDICKENYPPGRVLLWDGWDLLILTSPYQCCICSSIPDGIGDSYRLPNYKNPNSAIIDLLMQANGLVKINNQLIKT